MAQTIQGGTILLKLDDGNTIELYTAKTKKAKKSTDDLNRSEQTLNRNFKGASRQSSNTTKNFSKMAQGITGGLVPAYATLAANIFAIGAAFRFLQDAANYRILIEGQREYAYITGESLKLLTSRLQAATGQQLAFAEAAQSVAIARAAGLTSDQISRLGAVAKNASIALGRDLTDSLNRLVRGATKAEPELLDELGIILRLETATKRYADEINKTKDSLTIFEKSQAVVNEVLRQGEEKFGEFSTELNQFQLLAKSFDDLVNSIKMGLTGLAEFIAKGLTKNVVALAGSFALLGSGILRAITPEAPTIDTKAASKSARGALQGMLTEKGMSKFGKLNTKEDVKAFETAMTRKKSSYLNYSTYVKSESQNLLNVLKAHNAQLEAQTGNSFKRMGARWKAELFIMKAEYGNFVGFVKFTGMMLSRFISALGWAGLIISLVSVLGGLFDKFKDPATKKFEENLKNVNKQLKEQNEIVTDLAEKMKETATYMAAIVQEANFFSNFSFAGVATAFGTEGAKTGIANRNLNQQKLSKDQVELIKRVTSSLEQQRSRVLDNTDAADQLDKKLEVFTGTLEALRFSSRRLSDEAFDKLVEHLIDLQENGTLAADAITKFSTTTNLLKGAVEDFGTAMSSMRTQGTAFFRMGAAIGTFGKVLTDLGGASPEDIFKRFGVKGGMHGLVTDEATLNSLRQFVGDEAVDKILSTYTRKSAFAGGGYTRDPADVLKELGQLAVDEAERLAKVEIGFLTEKINLQTQFQEKSIGMPKIIKEEMNFRQKVNLIELEIEQTQKRRDELAGKGVELNKVEIAQHDSKIANLKAQLTVAERLANITTRAKDQLVDTFATSMQTAIQGLIQGTMSLKDAFKSMTQAVLQMMAQIIAKMIALKILGAMGMPIPMAEGGIIPMAKGGITGYRSGGIATEPTYLVGEGKHNEAVVPLPDGRSIPVNMKGNTGNNNIVINVDAGGNASSTGGNAEQGKALGMTIQMAVMETIQREKRPGGVLS